MNLRQQIERIIRKNYHVSWGSVTDEIMQAIEAEYRDDMPELAETIKKTPLE